MSDSDELPAQWINARLADLVDVLDGKRVPLNGTQRATMKGEFPYYGANGLVDHINDYIFDGHYVLLAEDGGNFDKPERGVAYEATGKFWVNNHAHILSPREDIKPRFLRHWLNAIDWMPFISGTTRAKLTQGVMNDVLLPIPPAAEQRRIVAKLDGLLVRTAYARRELDRVPKLIAHYKQAILTAAFTGALTQDWRTDRQFPDVTPNEIPDRLQSERDAKRVSMGIRPKGKNRSLPGRSVHLPDLDANWAWVTFDDCAWDLTVGHVGPMKDRYVTQGTPFLRSLNVKPNKLDVTKVGYIDERFERELAKSKLNAGDLVVVRTGEPGVAAVVPQALDGANCSDLVICRLVGALDAHYAAYYMNSEFARDVVRGFQVGVAQQHFNVGAMSAMPLPYAPDAEQKEIVRRIESAFAWLDKLAAEHTRAAALLPKLEQALLAKAFRGELVPQDPNDEPASVLLERIRAARAAAPERKRKPQSSDLPRAPRERAAMTKSRLDQDVMHQPYLAKHLRDAGGSAKVEDLFRSADLPVTDFYKQLAWEVDAGHVNDKGALLEAA